MTMRLKDKVAVITGGGSGLGKAVALAFAREGAKVAIADINIKNGESTVMDIRNDGGQAIYIQCDVSKAVDVEALFTTAVALHGIPDVVYANAAIELVGEDAKAHELSEDVWDRLLDVNLKGIWLTCKYALIEMLKNKRGSIIIAASPTGLFGLGPGETAYSTSKGGVVGLVRPMAADYARDGIRVNAIVPGFMDTPLNAKVLATAEMREQGAASVPMGRLGQPEDVAGLAVFLASGDSMYCTGGFYAADGGLMAV
jgi:NAD(P)-dependent dehydrogenase (short-subunit alcohol dehydrogenase family)